MHDGPRSPRAGRFGPKPAVRTTGGIAVTSHPLATEAAVERLNAGGNACDAALAAAVVQTVVEPHMTTITGQLSLLYFDAATGATTYLNGGLDAPAAPLGRLSGKDIAGGRGVAVPGFWAAFEAAAERFGTTPKRDLVAPAVALAREGFEVNAFLFGLLFEQRHAVGRFPEGRAIFMPGASLVEPGDILRQPAAATTLERLVDEGNDYFYRGDFAARFCDRVQQAGGVVTRDDLERYEVRVQEPVSTTYRGNRVVAAPPPDNGGLHLIEMLNMLELVDLRAWGPPTDSPDTLHVMAAVHNEVLDAGWRQLDPAAYPVPMELIASKEYAAQRLPLVLMSAPAEVTPVLPGSNHVTVVDGAGNAASLLHSCMARPWHNGLFVEGVSICAGGLQFLRAMPRPGARASVPIVPNLVFRDDHLVLASGSPSAGLLANVVQNTVNVLDFEMTLEESVPRPRFGGPATGGAPGLWRGRATIEADLDEGVRRAVERRGIPFVVVSPWDYDAGSFEGVRIDPRTGVREACADPRRTGAAGAA